MVNFVDIDDHPLLIRALSLFELFQSLLAAIFVHVGALGRKLRLG